MSCAFDPQKQAVKQIDLYKALYEFSKEFLTDKSLQAKFTAQNKSVDDYAIDELSKMLGVDAEKLRYDTELSNSLTDALIDAGHPAEKSRMMDSVFASIEANTDPEQAMTDSVSFLNTALLKAAKGGETTVKIKGGKEISVTDAEDLLNFLQRRQNPFVTSKSVIPGGQYQMSDKEFSMEASNNALLMTATGSLPATAEDFIESLERKMNRKISGTPFEETARTSFEREKQAARIESDPLTGTARAPYHIWNTDAYEAAKNLPELDRRVQEMLDFESLKMQPKVDDLFERLRNFVAQNEFEKVVAALDSKVIMALQNIKNNKIFPYLFVYLEAKAFALTEAALSEVDPRKRDALQVRAGQSLSDIKSYSQQFGRAVTSLNFIYQQLGRVGKLGQRAYAKGLLQKFQAESELERQNLNDEIKALTRNNQKLAKELNDFEKNMEDAKTEFVEKNETGIIEKVSSIIDNICKKFGFKK